MKKNGILFFIQLFLIFQTVSAGISFGLVDINDTDEVLFTARQNMAGTNPYRSLFYARIKNGMPEKQPEPLTCYPEQMELIDNNRILQIRNRYGIVRYNSYTDSISWVKQTKGMPVTCLPTIPYSISPNGQWACHMEKETLGSGRLILENTSTGKSVVLVEKIHYSYEHIPVKWCDDSSVLLYEKDAGIYFCNPDAMMRGVEVEERFRKIGSGTINSVEWASQRNLAYIDGYMLYRISSKELYTLGLYSGIIGRGKAIGRLPYRFDPKEDKFYTNQDASSIVLVQKNTLFSFLRIKNQDCDYLDVLYSKPYMDSDSSLIDSYVFWNKSEEPVIWMQKLPYEGGDAKASVYRIDKKAVNVLEIEEAGKPVLSPDGNKIAFSAGSAAYIYDINTWERLSMLSGEKILSLLWINKNSLYAGGIQSIRKWNMLAGTVETITLSTVAGGFWNKPENSIVADTGDGVVYIFDKEKSTWKKLKNPTNLSQITQNGRYRIYSGATGNKLYENALYIRTLSGKAVTKPMYEESVKKVPERQKVALLFDAYDNAEGLANVISVLKKYNVPATFCLNGEFIRRYPLETKQISLNNFECASMFFTTSDLTGDSFVIDEDFIRRGLARNEDEFYDCTGKELLLYWHAPYYKTNELITGFGQKAGYSYIDIERIVEADEAKESSEEIIQDYYESLVSGGGGIIPVTIGYSNTARPEPLYKDLDLLICAITDGNFEIAPLHEVY